MLPPVANSVFLLFLYFHDFHLHPHMAFNLHDHTYVYYIITHTYLRVGEMLTSLCTCSQVRCYAPHVFLTWLHIPLASFMLHYTCHLYMMVHTANIFHATPLRSTCLLYMIILDVLPEKWKDKMVARSQLAHRRWTNVGGITVKISFQTVSKQCPYKECKEQTVECWDMELCLPMAMAMPSLPCLVANSAQGSERTLRMRCCTCEWEN